MIKKLFAFLVILGIVVIVLSAYDTGNPPTGSSVPTQSPDSSTSSVSTFNGNGLQNTSVSGQASPDELLGSFCQAILQQNYAAAYQLTSSNYQSQHSLTDFQNEVQTSQNYVFLSSDGCSWNTSGNVTEIQWSGEDTGTSKVVFVPVELVQENGWKIDRFDLDQMRCLSASSSVCS